MADDSKSEDFSNVVSKFVAQITLLEPVFKSLSKYESSFSPESKQLFQAAQASLGTTLAETATWQTSGSIEAYLSADKVVERFKQACNQQQQAVNLLLSGSVPVPRSAKEDLGNVRTAILGLKFELPRVQQDLISQLRNLCASVHTENQQLDDIERQLDDIVRKVIEELHAVTTLEEQALKNEQKLLEEAIEKCRGTDTDSEQQYFSLVLNSLQRLHASQLEEESEPEEDEDDDEDDPFYMPLAPAAFKLADSNKYALLAQPIDDQQEKDFMIMMDDSDTGAPAAAGAPLIAPAVAPLPVAVSVPTVDEVASTAAAVGPSADAPPAESASEPNEGEQQAVPSAAATPSEEPIAKPPTAPLQALSLDNTEPTAPAKDPAITHPTSPTPPANEEKLKSFMNFLSGENPGACMFHAQMRLSFDGCRKLANFLKSSARVRALSLSHNYLGDDGLRILCEGLVYNTSITALDLPDNNVGDEGCKALAAALKNNVSLTQLQLAYNRIGDEGAAALAQVIKTNNTLKKLGMSHNNIGKKGCQALTEAIGSNQALKHLQLLPGNPVEDKDAKALAKALKRNKKFSIRTFLGLNE